MNFWESIQFWFARGFAEILDALLVLLLFVVIGFIYVIVSGYAISRKED